MDWISYVVGFVFFLNFIFAGILIFLERKDASSTWAWLMVLFFIPLAGFALYLLLGRQLNKKRLFNWEGHSRVGIQQLIHYQIEAIHNKEFVFKSKEAEKLQDLIFMHLYNNDAVLTQDNEVEIIVDGQHKFETLFKDIEDAKDHIHLQTYILRRDDLGSRLLSLLIKKAKAGIKVRILYDDMGSRGMNKRFFRDLRAAGGEIEAFFPSKVPLINPRLNFRNHRKLIIIDGRIGYIGGFNVGDEYLGIDKRFGYWRDTHLRVEGSAVHPIQTRFILDWNQASYRYDINYSDEYFPPIPLKGEVAMQIVSSGPDSEWEQIKNGYIKLITGAKKYIYIQTPYFIPDESLLDSLRIAALSGVDVRIMIPNKPDHMFVYWATYSYVGELMKAGARIYIYENGFIHAKTLVTDDTAASVGTANIDLRSFSLNFEVNAFIYHQETATNLCQIFIEDMELSTELTPELYQKRSLYIRFKESISRLLSPIL
ncbi:cardiolipin synthase [Jeotgalibacillus proteolyticus]|uniref:Cardiolipin synthase n=1 Tax=Jeotgalibacillus proteolyticus TaxID=2082395 RepID=A0A2S5GC39_9BACL|nr:cardiolipin synthase [Jeotgalibacillus proteolyticus]PPA70580.1 cardiolipin synthase [Jeotgalibacillus proteolyticus]